MPLVRSGLRWRRRRSTPSFVEMPHCRRRVSDQRVPARVKDSDKSFVSLSWPTLRFLRSSSRNIFSEYFSSAALHLFSILLLFWHQTDASVAETERSPICCTIGKRPYIYNMGSIVHTFFLEVKDILLIINFLVPDPSHRIPKKKQMLVQDVGARCWCRKKIRRVEKIHPRDF